MSKDFSGHEYYANSRKEEWDRECAKWNRYERGSSTYALAADPTPAMDAAIAAIEKAVKETVRKGLKEKPVSLPQTLPSEVKEKSLSVNHGGSYIPSKADWDFMLQWGAQAIGSGMLPSAIKTKEAAAIVILKGRELGLSFMTSVAHIHVVNGKPSMSAELMQSLARKNLPGLTIDIIESTNKSAKVEFCRPGGRKYVQSFTWDEAVEAKLTVKDVWKHYPAAMLYSRCISAGLRKIAPDALMGVSYTPEELGASVDESGNVIETTGKVVTETEPNPMISMIAPTITSGRSAEHLAEIQKVLLLKEQLEISDDELKEFLHAEFKKESLKTLSLNETQLAVDKLTLVKQARESEKPAQDEDQEWMKESMGQLK